MEETILDIVRARLNRAPCDRALDDYLLARIRAAIAELGDKGITAADTPRDCVLVADLVTWEYQSRDKPGGMPDWLRLMIRERWIAEKEGKT